MYQSQRWSGWQQPLGLTQGFQLRGGLLPAWAPIDRWTADGKQNLHPQMLQYPQQWGRWAAAVQACVWLDPESAGDPWLLLDFWVLIQVISWFCSGWSSLDRCFEWFLENPPTECYYCYRWFPGEGRSFHATVYRAFTVAVGWGWHGCSQSFRDRQWWHETRVEVNPKLSIWQFILSFYASCYLTLSHFVPLSFFLSFYTSCYLTQSYSILSIYPPIYPPSYRSIDLPSIYIYLSI